MLVELKIKEIREKLLISLSELAKDTGIEIERLEKIEDNVDEILFIELLVISKVLNKEITDLYLIKNIEIK